MEGMGKVPPLQVRIPDELKTWLKHQAVDNRRSLNGEILIRLEQSRAQRPQGAPSATKT